MWTPLLEEFFNCSARLGGWGWKLLAERSCLNPAMTGLALEFAKELLRGAKGLFGADEITGVRPCGCLQFRSTRFTPTRPSLVTGLLTRQDSWVQIQTR